MGIETIIYVTQPHVGLTNPIVSKNIDSSEDEEEQQEKGAGSESDDYISVLKKDLSHIEFREGRPDVYNIVDESIKEANGPIAFATCAHATMVDDARKSVRDNLQATKYRVELFEQIQMW